MTVINSRPMIFSRLFHEGLFFVPWHQRRYDWKKEHVLDLLHDIDEAVTENRRCYFLGSIMLVQRNERAWEINDGQQRMITFSLVCARLCRLFNQQNTTRFTTVHEAHALRILFDLDENSTDNLSEADDFNPRLTPPRDDQSRYHLMIRGKNLGTNGKLTAAWQEIDHFISAMGRQKAEEFFDFLTKKVEVSCLYIPNDVDPNSVYETINCRGKQLEDLDLIRNYLYSYFNGDKEINRRDTVHSNLENARAQLRDDTKAADYVRCYFQCRYGFLPKAKFYHEVRKHIGKNSDSVIARQEKPADYIYNLVDDFASRERIELFRTISNPKTADAIVRQFSTHSRSTKAKRNLLVFLRELQTYKVAQPMIFSLLIRYVEGQGAIQKQHLAKYILSCVKNITSFIMRTAFITTKFEPSKFESEFSNLAKKILSVNSRTSLFNVNIMEQLKEYDSHYGIIEDGKFIEKLANIEMNDIKKAKRFLVGLNAYMQTDGHIINEKECTVEHVLPKSEEHWLGWSGFRGKKHVDWVCRIGNLTLLGESDNKPGKGSNGDFPKKKAILGRSALVLTKKIAESNDWSPCEIDKRQKAMAKLAAQVWAFSS